MTDDRSSDRRVQRSKRALKNALIQLMIEKGYEETTVADITERADVGRSTFYAHFADKQDLLQESVRGLRDFLLSAPELSDDKQQLVHPALAFSLPMLRHVSEASELFGALVGKRTGMPVQQELHAMLVDLVCEKLEQAGSPVSAPAPLVAQFIVGAFFAVLNWWMSDPSQATPEQVDQHFRELALWGVVQSHRTT